MNIIFNLQSSCFFAKWRDKERNFWIFQSLISLTHTHWSWDPWETNKKSWKHMTNFSVNRNQHPMFDKILCNKFDISQSHWKINLSSSPHVKMFHLNYQEKKVQRANRNNYFSQIREESTSKTKYISERKSVEHKKSLLTYQNIQNQRQ